MPIEPQCLNLFLIYLLPQQAQGSCDVYTNSLYFVEDFYLFFAPQPFLQDPGVQPAPLSCESTVKIKGQETYYVLQVIPGVTH